MSDVDRMDLRRYLKEVETDDPDMLAKVYPDVLLWKRSGLGTWREATVAEVDEWRQGLAAEQGKP